MIFRGRKGAKMKRLRSLSALICAVLLAAAVPGVYAAGDSAVPETAEKVVTEGKAGGIIVRNRYFPGEGKSFEECLTGLQGFVDGSGTLKAENAAVRGWGVERDPKEGSRDQDGAVNYAMKVFTTTESANQGGLKYKIADHYGPVPSMWMLSYRIYPVKLGEAILSIGSDQNTVCLMGTDGDGIQVKDPSGKVIYKTGVGSGSSDFKFNDWNQLAFLVNEKEKTFRMFVNGQTASYGADGGTVYDFPYRKPANSANMLSFLATKEKENEFYIDDVNAFAAAPFVTCEADGGIEIDQENRRICCEAGTTAADLLNRIETRALIAPDGTQTTYAWGVYDAEGNRVEIGAVGTGCFAAAFPSDAAETAIWYDIVTQTAVPEVYRWYDFDEFTNQSAQLTNPFRYAESETAESYMYGTGGETGFTFWTNNAQVTENKAPGKGFSFDVRSGEGDKFTSNRALVMETEEQKEGSAYMNFYPCPETAKGSASYDQLVIDLDYCYTGDATQQYFQFFTSYSADSGASWKEYTNNFLRMSAAKFGYATGDSDAKVTPFSDENGEMTFEKGRWYNLKAVVNNGTNTLTLYIDGTQRYSGALVPAEKLGEGMIGNTYRIKIAAAYQNSAVGTGAFALDNIRSYSYPQILEDTYFHSSADNIRVQNLQEIITVEQGTTAEELMAALGGNAEAERNRRPLTAGELADGDVVYASNGTFASKYDVVVLPSGGGGKFLTSGQNVCLNRDSSAVNLQFAAGKNAEDSVFYIAGFDQEGQLQSVERMQRPARRGEIVHMPVRGDSLDKDKIYRAYAWKETNLEPLAAPVNLSQTAVPELYIAGDSLACRYRRSNSRQGYGDYLAARLSPEVAVHNYALGGSSSASFRSSWRWQNILRSMKPGDVVLIGTMHNDHVGNLKVTPEVYKKNLEAQYQDAAERGGRVIFCAGGTVAAEGYADFHQGYYEAMQSLADEKGCTFIDLYKPMIALMDQEGLADVRDKYYEPGDTTHLNGAGADLLAGWMLEQLRDQQDPLSIYLN